MKVRHLAGFALLIGFLSAPALAQTSGSVVKVAPGAASYNVSAAAATPIQVVMNIDSGYHTNSNTPSEQFLIATVLKLEAPAGVRTTRVIYPRGKMKKFSFSDKPLSVYEGRVVLRFTARAGANAARGAQTIRGKLTVQACNDQACLRPQTVDVNIPINVQ